MPQVGQPDPTMIKILETTSPSKRNKRKSQEPIKRLSTCLDQDFKRAKLEQQTSDGEDHHTTPSPRLSSSLSPGSSSECGSPSPFSMAPKKRFKNDAMKDIIEKKSPFRPWDDNNKEDHKSNLNIPSGILSCHPYLLWLQHPTLSLGASAQGNLHTGRSKLSLLNLNHATLPTL